MSEKDFMFTSKQNFKYLEHISSVNKDGEKYVSVTVLFGTQKKSFVSHDEELIKLLNSLQLQQFCDITLIVGFNDVFNPNTRYSNWRPTLLGVE